MSTSFLSWPMDSTSNATRIGTLAADCIGVPLSGISRRTRLSVFVGRYRSSPRITTCDVKRHGDYSLGRGPTPRNRPLCFGLARRRFTSFRYPPILKGRSALSYFLRYPLIFVTSSKKANSRLETPSGRAQHFNNRPGLGTKPKSSRGWIVRCCAGSSAAAPDHRGCPFMTQLWCREMHLLKVVTILWR